MPISDETFEAQLINVAEIESDPERGIKGHVRLEFGNGSASAKWEDAAFIKRMNLAPQTAIAVGKGLVEAGERLDKPELEAVGDMAAADAAAAALARLT